MKEAPFLLLDLYAQFQGLFDQQNPHDDAADNYASYQSGSIQLWLTVPLKQSIQTQKSTSQIKVSSMFLQNANIQSQVYTLQKSRRPQSNQKLSTA